MISDQIKSIAHSLRLFGIHACAEKRAEEALAKALHPLEFLRLVLEEEQLSRRDRFGKSLISRARFRWGCDLEDWDHSYDRGIPKPKLKELNCLAFFQNRENILIFGKTGEGKTHLAQSLGRRLCSDGHQTIFLSVNLLFEELQAERAAGRYLTALRKLIKAKVLILDDFGVRSYTHEEATTLLDLLEERYHKGSQIVTSQVDSKGWLKLFEDPVIAEAIVDRLLHPSQKIILKGGSYRERHQNYSKSAK